MHPVHTVRTKILSIAAFLFFIQTAGASVIVDGTVASAGSPSFKTLAGLSNAYNPYCNCYGYTENALVFGMGSGFNPTFASNWLVTNSSSTSTTSNLYSTNSGTNAQISVDSVTMSFSSLPTVTYNNRLYWVLMYDAQENVSNNGNNYQLDVNLDWIQFRTGASSYTYNSTTGAVSGGTLLYTTQDSLVINPQSSTTKTLTPNGNGADVAIYIPVRAFTDNFQGIGTLSGSTTFTMIVQQSRGDGGKDEWGKIGSFGSSTYTPPIGSVSTGTITTPGEEKPTPEPSTFVLGAVALCAVVARRHYSKA